MRSCGRGSAGAGRFRRQPGVPQLGGAAGFVSGQVRAEAADPILILRDLGPVQPRRFSGLAEESDGPRGGSVVGPGVHLLAFDRRGEVVALHVHRDVVRGVVVHHHGKGRLDPVALLPADHRVVHHGDDRPQPGLHDRELHGVVVLLVLRAHHPAHALLFDLSVELQPVVGEGLGRPEQCQISNPHVSVGAVRPAGSPFLRAGAPRLHPAVEGIPNLHAGAAGERLPEFCHRTGLRLRSPSHQGPRRDRPRRGRILAGHGLRLPAEIDYLRAEPQGNRHHDSRCDLSRVSQVRSRALFARLGQGEDLGDRQTFARRLGGRLLFDILEGRLHLEAERRGRDSRSGPDQAAGRRPRAALAVILEAAKIRLRDSGRRPLDLARRRLCRERRDRRQPDCRRRAGPRTAPPPDRFR